MNESLANRLAQQSAPAALRNRTAILDVISPHLPPGGLVLELASGTGEHALFFAGARPDVTFQPTDCDVSARASIDAYAEEAGLANLRPALFLDATQPETWPVERADGVLCINMIHIAPWAATVGLIAGAARVLPVGGKLVLYGPYLRDGVETAPSNLAFDGSLEFGGWKRLRLSLRKRAFPRRTLPRCLRII
jgi:SAM-dependent methyltransferase